MTVLCYTKSVELSHVNSRRKLKSETAARNLSDQCRTAIDIILVCTCLAAKTNLTQTRRLHEPSMKLMNFPFSVKSQHSSPGL